MKSFLKIYFLLVLLPSLVKAATAPSQPTIITSDQLDARSTDTETDSTFTDHVKVTGTNLLIQCDHLEVITTKLADKTDTLGNPQHFKYMLATGHVTIIQADREATCERAEVMPNDDKITLTGHPSVTDHGNGSILTGEPLILYKSQRIARGKNVKITMPPLKDLGYDKNQSPPSAAPAASETIKITVPSVTNNSAHGESK
jgi:lipopolysaccharide export system protein LptA